MATKAKKSRGKPAKKKTGAKRAATSRGRSASAKPMKKAKRGAVKRAAAPKKKKMRAKPVKRAAKPAVKKRTAKKPSRSPIARVKRVAQEVAQQAQTAMTSGMETLKELGESIVERVEHVTNPT